LRVAVLANLLVVFTTRMDQPKARTMSTSKRGKKTYPVDPHTQQLNQNSATLSTLYLAYQTGLLSKEQYEQKQKEYLNSITFIPQAFSLYEQ